MAGILYVVATPIGNLEDMTERARRVLDEVDLVLAEDTRRVDRLLRALGLSTPVESYHGDTADAKRERLVRRIADGATMALASDAGTPAIADPGAQLVADVIAAGADVVAVPGPCSVTAALSISGLRSDRFEFSGYAPRRPNERREFLAQLLASPVTSVFYESPHRLIPCLEDLVAVAGADLPLVICRELTKMHEETLRITAADALAHFRRHEPRGEFTLLLPAGEARATEEGPADEAIRGAAQRLIELGAGTRDAADLLHELTGRGRNEMYRLLLELREDQSATS